ncbi:MAG TPA: HAD family hydrolase [Bacteroidia bacterium]|nr:HAD family hydrolase [Bacteroidia bacterium]
MKKAVFFDFDDTLYDQDLYYLAVFRTFSGMHGIDGEQMMRSYRSLKGKSRDIFGGVLSEMGIYSADLQEELFRLYRTQEVSIPVYPDADEILGWLKEKNIATGIITNGVVDVQKNKVKATGMDHRVDIVVYARTWGAGFEKPHPRAFGEALERAGVSAGNAIFVGDVPETDIRGAEAAGIANVFLVDRNGKFENNSGYKRISELTELKKIISEIWKN